MFEIIKKEWKDIFSVIKKIVPKETKILVQSDDQNRIRLITEQSHLVSIHSTTSQSTSPVSVYVGLDELDKIIKSTKAKDKIERFEVEVQPGKFTVYPIELVIPTEDATNQIAFSPEYPMAFFENSEKIVAMIDDASTLLSKDDQECMGYLKIEPSRGLIVESKQITFYPLKEKAGFKEFLISKKQADTLSKVLSGALLQYGFVGKQDLVLQDGAQLFMLKTEREIVFPELKKMRTSKAIAQCVIDTEALQTQLKDIKKDAKGSAKKVWITSDLNHMTFAFQAEHTAITVPYHNKSIPFKACFEWNAFKVFVFSQKGDIELKWNDFKNVYGDDGYMWMAQTPEKITMIAGITDPSFENTL
jgi:hypothetical protein